MHQHKNERFLTKNQQKIERQAAKRGIKGTAGEETTCMKGSCNKNNAVP
jgi:hypothetical protein